MLHDPKAYLYDIVKACDAIISYTKGMDNVGYLQDRMIQDAVERNFITIGEALNRIKQRLNNSKVSVKSYYNSATLKRKWSMLQLPQQSSSSIRWLAASVHDW